MLQGLYCAAKKQCPWTCLLLTKAVRVIQLVFHLLTVVRQCCSIRLVSSKQSSSAGFSLSDLNIERLADLAG